MTTVPGSRPHQTREETIAILKKHDITFDNHVVLLGVRGYYRDSMGVKGANDIDMYDDALFVVSPTAYATFNFNTDPAKAGHYLAMLDPGVYDFCKGDHHPHTPKAYHALRPFPEGIRLPCTRDGVHSTCALTNIHKGGFNDTFSEGCQTIYPTQYAEAMPFIYNEMTKHKQTIVKYVLIAN